MTHLGQYETVVFCYKRNVIMLEQTSGENNMNSYIKLLFLVLIINITSCSLFSEPQKERDSAFHACGRAAFDGLPAIAEKHTERFLGKVSEDVANCRGGKKALANRNSVWVDWSNYWGTGAASSKAVGPEGITLLGEHLRPNGRGVDGTLLDLEYQRMELIRFNLFDNNTYKLYVTGEQGTAGPLLKKWDAMKLAETHPEFQQVTTATGRQVCRGELIRHRNLTGICNDIYNPAMGATNQIFARNIQFEATFPRLGKNDLARNRHADRLSLLTPDPQVISRKLFSRKQASPDVCNFGKGVEGGSLSTQCDYKKAPFFNVLAAYWIQFMTHDWFYHLREGRNSGTRMSVGCTTQMVDNKEVALTPDQVKKLGCRPSDHTDTILIAEHEPAPVFEYQNKQYLARAPRTTQNTVTAWWDASQIYGFDELSIQRVKRDPKDTARLLMRPRGNHAGTGETQGYMPVFAPEDPINPAWKGQEATAFGDAWTVGLSFYHNTFIREHNLFVDSFRDRAAATPKSDSGLRNPDKPEEIITNEQVTNEELFQIARMVVAAEIAKIHTIEWTTQLLYDEPMFMGMNANWNGLLEVDNPLGTVLEKVVVNQLASSNDVTKANQLYSVFASGAGIFGLGSHRYEDHAGFLGYIPDDKDIWSITNPEHVNGGINHFGSPFNFPEEFTTVYRLHPLLPDVLEFREWNAPDTISKKVPIINTFRAKATVAMTEGGLGSWALSMGRQRLGALTLQNHPQFLQNIEMSHTPGVTEKIDLAALDLIRDRERGIPRFNEFRRQYGLTYLKSFDDFIDQRVAVGSDARKEQQRMVELLREVYGQHVCDASKVISNAQLNTDGSEINDCLGHPDGTLVDNIEDLDTVVGWLSEYTRPHGFAISETQFHVFILNASRRLFSDRFFTSSFRPEFYSHLGVEWVTNNGPDGKQMETEPYNGHVVEVSPMKRILLRTVPELASELVGVMNVFDPWARDKGEYYSLQWKPKASAINDPSFN